MTTDDNVAATVTTGAIPTGTHDVTPAWLTSVLTPRFGGVVMSASAAPIGTGQIADSLRLSLAWDPPAAGPETLVAKVTASSPQSREAARATRTYEVEVGFYSDLAATLPVRAPRCYWAGYDAERVAYGVLLEDVAPAVQGDQIRGCSPDEAALAVDELALLHAPVWGAAGLHRLPWLTRGGGTAGAAVVPLVQMLLPGFLERYASRLGDDVVALAERALPRLTAPPPVGEVTVVHGDFRNDNLMFGGPRVCVLDWQTVGIGHAVSDLSYFLGGSLLVEDRRAAERDLLRRYRDGLAAAGVELGEDDCWRQYRRFAFSGLVMAVIASMLVGRTDRGDDMFVAMAERAATHALDLEAEDLLAGPS